MILMPSKDDCSLHKEAHKKEEAIRHNFPKHHMPIIQQDQPLQNEPASEHLNDTEQIVFGDLGKD